MRLLAHIIFIASVGLCSGCRTFWEHSIFCSSENPVYGGTRGNCRDIFHQNDTNQPGQMVKGTVLVSVVDLPFSLVADTLLLPFDLVEWSEVSTPDPLKGWTFREFPVVGPARYGARPNILDKAIIDDYQNYMAKRKQTQDTPIRGFYEDGTGRRAVEFESWVAGNESWHYAFIYDKENKRVKVVRYGRRRTMS